MSYAKIFLRKFLSLVFFGLFALAFLGVGNVSASSTNGTIDTTYKYAWGENLGWINFGCDGCDVLITDDAITGHAWSTQYGWINLDPTNGGVTNDAEGTLAGRAWGSNVGWINFTGVTINSSGEFLGYATLDSDSSQINFNCANGSSCSSADFKVKTDWLPASARPVAASSSGSRPRVSGAASVITSPIVEVVDNITDLVLDFFTPSIPTPEITVYVPLIPP